MDKDNQNFRIGANDELAQIQFQVYQQPITNTRPEKQLITLHRFLDYIEDPPSRIREIFFQIAQAELADDKEEKARLKQKHLYYFNPCVIVDPVRRYEYIKSFTGLLVLDFDHIDNAEEFKYFLFDEYKCIIAAWLSPSKRGVKCLVKIPIVGVKTPIDESIREFKEYYYGIAEEMDVYSGFDGSGQNAVLPLFQSYDPDLLDRNNPETWTIKGIKRNDYTTAPTLPPPNIDITDKDKETIVKIINTGFDNITDYGHPPLRGLCVVIGGYVAAGYIDEYDALQIINYQIESHSYLKKGIAGYKKTALSAIKKGQGKPLTLKKF